MQIFEGAPLSLEGYSENERKIYGLLQELGLSFKRVEHEAVCSIEECRAIDELLAPAKHCKNLFLCPTNKSKYYMLVMDENKKFQSGKISRQVKSSRLQFGCDEELAEYLGVKPGAVGVLALANDEKNRVQLVVDEDVLKSEYVTGHPGVNTASVALKTSDLFVSFLSRIKHDYIVVKCE